MYKLQIETELYYHFRSQKSLQTVQRITKANSYHCHSEGILLSMLADDNADIRKRAINIIRNIRTEDRVNHKSIRSYQIPNLNFKATKYYDLITPEELSSEPPITKKFTLQELLQFQNKPLTTGYSVTTVKSEQTVKLMTSCAGRLTSPTEQDGMIINIKRARMVNPGPVTGYKYKFD
jgi:hypothetical protein